MVSFGAAPALVIYEWSLRGMGKLGWLAAELVLSEGFDGEGLDKGRFNGEGQLKRPYPSISRSFCFMSRHLLKPAAHSGMPRWQDRLFIILTRIANDATDYFQIPTGRVVEVGTQVTI